MPAESLQDTATELEVARYEIARYLVGDAPLPSREVVRDPQMSEALDTLREWWKDGEQDASAACRGPINTEAALNRVLMKTEQPSRSSESRSSSPGVWRTLARYGIAVGAMAVMGAGIFWMTRHDIVSPAVPSAPMSPVAYHTQAGERATITLQDGSIVFLAPASTLDVAGRTVTLQGQALFTVVGDADEPFVVLANGVRTTVLGTEFGVRAYGDSVAVAVRSGRVAVRDRISAQSTTSGIVLGSNDMATVTTNGMAIARQASVERELAFARGELIFENVALENAVSALNRWFDADVRIADPELAQKLLTATYTSGNARELADLLSMTFNVRAERSGRIITLLPR